MVQLWSLKRVGVARRGAAVYASIWTDASDTQSRDAMKTNEMTRRGSLGD